MADTRRTWAALAVLFADNTAGAISPQDLRDGFKSLQPHVTSSAPDENDDEASGFDTDHAWIDTSTTPDSLYRCLDASTGAAVWVKVYPASAGSVALDDLTDVDTSGSSIGDVLADTGSGWAPLTLATVATTGSYDDLDNKPTLGTAAAQNTSAFATAAQGGLADTAVQPGDDADTLGSGDATNGYVLTADGAGGAAWEAAAGGGGGAEALDDLSDVDTSGASDNDLLGVQSGVWLPIANTSDFATAAQGTKADAALPKLAAVNSYAGNRTLDSSDSGAYVRITAAGTVTLPDGLSNGFQCVIVNATDASTVALSAATTLTIPSGFDAEVQNRRAVTVIHVGSNVWEAHGALVEST